MSSLGKEPIPLMSGVKHNTVNGSTNQINNEISEALLNDCLDALLYQDAEFKALTHTTVKLIEDAKGRMGEANASFIEGIRRFYFEDIPFKLFVKAEEKGCKHPALYYFMGECYRSGWNGVSKDLSKALEYYEKAIAGGCVRGLQGRYSVLSVSQHDKRLQNLLDLEKEGHIEGYIFKKIGEQYKGPRNPLNYRPTAISYFQQAIDYGYAYAAVNLSCYLESSQIGDSNRSPHDKAALFLVDFDRKGLGIKDDRILWELVDMLLRGRAAHLPTFKNPCEMALHYCDILIQRRSPLGYQSKANIYEGGLDGVAHGKSRAVAIREEADRLGLADYSMCCLLQSAYAWGRGVIIDGLKVLEYSERALQIATFDGCIISLYDWMSSVYEGGVDPVKRDGRKVVECYERALQDVTSPSDSAGLRKKLGNFYVQGIAVPPNGAKALEYYIKALEFGVGCHDSNIYYGIATVYERGIPPIAQNLEIAAELWPES